jgi:hypothetical protein
MGGAPPSPNGQLQRMLDMEEKKGAERETNEK